MRYLHTELLGMQTYRSAQKSVLVANLSKLSSLLVCVIPVCSASLNFPATQGEGDQCLHWGVLRLAATGTQNKVPYYKIRHVTVVSFTVIHQIPVSFMNVSEG
jgi:hypothetical protein